MGIESDLRRTRQMYDEMQGVLGLPPESRERVVPRISAWSPLQQIAHVSKSNRWIISSVVAILTGRREFETQGSIKPIGRLVLRSGLIPRGVGKSPSVARPDDLISTERLTEELRQQLGNMGHIHDHLEAAKSSRQTFEHPYFGHLNPRQWIRFVRVHTNHHLKIVSEILSTEEL
ncbi:MAG: DinB family protein [Rhodothermia bacterium]|nr:DinB family protein [Rhodothermia bacterium]